MQAGAVSVESKNTSTANTDKHPTLPPTTFKGRCFFLKIPVELRQLIYEHVLASPTKYSSSNKDVLQYATAILYTNNQIFMEAMPVLRMCEDSVLDRCHKKTAEAGVSYNGSITPIFSNSTHNFFLEAYHQSQDD